MRQTGLERHAVVERRSIPPAVLPTAANVHDSKVFEELIDAVEPIRRPGGDLPRKRPGKLHADKGYGFTRCRERSANAASRVASPGGAERRARS